MAIYMCTHCYNLYKHNYIKPLFASDGQIEYYCPKLNCPRDNMVEIDDAIAKYISALNKMRYHTKACCSGHNYEVYKDIYIYFNKNYDFPFLPNGWAYDPDRKDIIRYRKVEPKLINDIDIGDAMHELELWINKLCEERNLVTIRNK